MINYNSNINVIVKAKLEQIQELRNNPDPVLRAVALAVLPEFRHRIHVEGKDSSGGQIGTYSPGYMIVRTGAYKNADRKTKGTKKGELKNAGKYTKGLNIKVFGTIVEDTSKAGLSRPKYNRTSDTKVVASLTRQMENDESVVATGNGYGIGFLNPLNFKKALWVEATYKKPILTKLTTGERELAKKTATEFLPEYLKAI
ncbi:MAG: hypothetical protein JWO92_1107 [Chitinophagaceae bacterium]|nr:hypothetical protein [Chitinophagaceae bacterium]